MVFYSHWYRFNCYCFVNIVYELISHAVIYTLVYSGVKSYEMLILGAFAGLRERWRLLFENGFIQIQRCLKLCNKIAINGSFAATRGNSGEGITGLFMAEAVAGDGFLVLDAVKGVVDLEWGLGGVNFISFLVVGCSVRSNLLY